MKVQTFNKTLYLKNIRQSVQLYHLVSLENVFFVVFTFFEIPRNPIEFRLLYRMFRVWKKFKVFNCS